MKKIIIIFITLFVYLDRISSVDSKMKSTEVTLEEKLEGYDVNKKVIVIPGTSKLGLPYNPVVQIDYMLYLSGQIGIDPATRQLISDDVRNQTRQIFFNIESILHEAGSNLNQIMRCLVLLTDINDYQSMNEIYASSFRSIEDYPARTTFAVQSLPANAKIEIECIAYTKRHYLYFIVSIQGVWSQQQYESTSDLNSFDSYYSRILSVPNAVSSNRQLSKYEYISQMIQTNNFGLPKCIEHENKCQQIGIVGAGASGLYAGILLARSGHTVTIYEASDRAGGRIFTYRDPKNPSLYIGELGAMRFPLEVHPNLNTLLRQRYKHKLNITEFYNSNDDAYVFLNGIYATIKQAQENPDIFQFNTSESERGKTPGKLWFDAIQPIFQTLKRDDWSSFREHWDSYSVQSYLNKVNLSRFAIDYINIYRFWENSPSTALMSVIRSSLIFGNSSKFYMIVDGNDLLIRAMVEECQEIESNRCSIVYSTPITKIQLYDPNQVRWTTKNGTSQMFNTVIVATTAPAAQLIDFDRRIDFISKYRTFRQVNYMCATKILLSFNVSWWYTQENLSGGQSITDLNLRNVYYPRIINNQTDGGTMLASYTYGQDTLIWQSLSESDAIELVLKQLIQLHRSSPNIRDFFQGGKIQNWCEDPYAHAAFTSFVPLQETKLVDDLQASVSNIHFIGEHTSLTHGWVEGALISAIRAALTIAGQTEIIFDVIIVGGNPIGLATAVFLSLKQPGLRIAIVEKDVIINGDNSSSTFDQQKFRQMFNEEYLVELANMSLPLWRQIEHLANMSVGSILNTNDGFLFLGDPNTNQSTVEGNFVSIKRTCKNLHMDCEYLNNTQLQTRYPMFTFPRQYEGIFHNQSGYINVTMLITALLRIIAQDPNIAIRQQERFLSLKLNDRIQVVTDRSVLHASRKVLFVPGSHVKNIARSLNFDLDITLWQHPVYYFRRLPTVTQFPTWFSWDGNDVQSLYSGFPIDWTSDYISISPNLIANMSNPLMYSSQQTNTIDPALTRKVVDWVSGHMGTYVNASDYYFSNRTWLCASLPDHGFLLDYVPRTDRRVLIQAAGCDMDLIPVWGDILSNMILFEINIGSKYSKYIDYFSLSRSNRLIEGMIRSNEATKITIKPERPVEKITIPNKGQQMISSIFLFLCCLFILLH